MVTCFCQQVTSMLPALSHQVTTTLVVCCQHIVSISLACCQHVNGMWLAYCQQYPIRAQVPLALFHTGVAKNGWAIAQPLLPAL